MRVLGAAIGARMPLGTVIGSGITSVDDSGPLKRRGRRRSNEPARSRQRRGVGLAMRSSDAPKARLESALAGALQLGDRQGDELARLSRVNARQKRTLWRTFCLLKQGRRDDAVAALEAELRDRETVR